MDNRFKAQLHAHCIELLEVKIKEVKHALRTQKEGSKESSSAGDKHNTEQAMLHLEEEKKLQQLHFLEENLKNLKKLSGEEKKQKVEAGALVVTNKGAFYFAAPLGKVTFQEKEVMILSLAAPLGRILSKMKVGESVCFNSEMWVIQEVK